MSPWNQTRRKRNLPGFAKVQGSNPRRVFTYLDLHSIFEFFMKANNKTQTWKNMIAEWPAACSNKNICS